MADIGLRDLGAFVPGGRSKDMAREPIAPPIPPRPAPAGSTVLVTPPPAPAPLRTVFGGDRAVGRDALGVDDTLAHVAELAAHRGTQGPLCIGLLGGPGSGKSFALGRLVARVRDLAAAAAGSPGQGPYLSRIHIQTIDAAALDGDPALALAARLHAGLRQPYPALAREIGATARDPHVVLREANEKLDDARRRLDSERRALDDAGSRRARLTETVLYEAAGSQVDAYARANRAGIESRLAGFGLTGEPVRTYKDLVQLVSGSGGTIGLVLRSLWAFKGQTKLIVLAIALVAIGIGLGIAIDDQSIWLGDLREGPKTGATVADWFQTHIGLLATARTAAFGLAALAVVVNIFRAVGFLRPIFKGAQLLESDLDNRRRDLDGLYAHQTKRVDALEGDVERLTRDVAEAERRAGGAGTGALSEPSPFESGNTAMQAQTVFTMLGETMDDGQTKAATSARAEAPQRVVIALDHLDAVLPERARAIFDALHRAAGPGIVTIVGVDTARLDPKGLRRNELERWIQVPLRLDGVGSPTAYQALVREALGHGDRGAVAAKPDPRRSDLDSPIDDEEAAILVSLADLAGRTPRAVKRFANLYRMARLGDERQLAILAFMLALAQGGTDVERKVVAEALAGDQASAFDLPNADGRLRAAYGSAIAAGGRVSKGEAAEASRRAAIFSLAP